VAQEALAVQVAQEALVVQVAQEAREALVVQVAPAELAVRVALAELVIVPVEEELEHDQAVEPARNHPPAQLAVAPKIKSVTAAHHRGLVPVIVAEDLAVAAEITRDPAAPEAVIVWGVAVTAVAAVGIVVAVE
jgi:hypothetical protein